jgi:hypothetical protein
MYARKFIDPIINTEATELQAAAAAVTRSLIAFCSIDLSSFLSSLAHFCAGANK